MRVKSQTVAVLETKHGFLLTLEREGDVLTPTYRGTVAENDREFAVTFAVAADGAVTPGENVGGCPAELLERARLVVRATWKQNAALELPAPRRITRWRPAK